MPYKNSDCVPTLTIGEYIPSAVICHLEVLVTEDEDYIVTENEALIATEAPCS